MNERALKTLEYNKIIDTLIEYSQTPLGRDQCKNLVPFSSLIQIQKAQRETSDALTRVFQKGSVSFSGTRDIRGEVKRLEVGSILGIGELLNISSVLNVAAKAKNFGRREDSELLPDSLTESFDSLEPLTPINQEIKRCILSEDEVSDDASPGLRHVRRSMKSINDRIHTQMNSILNSSRNYLQDAVITMRDGRYCLPVKQEYKSQFQGMIHDQSSSGSTLFMEPMAIVKLNNDLREFEIQELKEIEAILASLSNLAGEQTELLRINLEALSHLDFIFAKASLSRHFKCSEPIFNDHGYINIKKGRHPLLDPKNVVPIDVHLGKDFSLLIVTGPNTGGKTVSLKTVGLFTLMGQAGLHIPAFDRSELAVFGEVFSDIGDEQSIEQNLSTFSSHMTNIVSILENADADSLCLFDELGAGTDPTEGAALAMAILSFLHKQKIRTMSTTHYSELKVFALTTPEIENACCEFDVATLRPTYRLLIGIPGKSNAFAISKKLGLPDFIITDAKGRIETKDETFEDLISNLENNRVTIEKEQGEIQLYKSEVEKLKKRLEDKQEKFEERKERMIRESNEEAQKILRDAKEYADQTIKTMNKLVHSSGVSKEMEVERSRLRDRLSSVEDQLSLKNKNTTPKKSVSAGRLKIGDGVRVLTMNLNGTVSSLPNAKGDLYVQMGILRSLVNIKDIALTNEPSITGIGQQPTGSGKIKMSKSSSISPEINLIGKTVDEALPDLDKYLDDAYLSHLGQVRVVHGRGTGALKAAVHKHLKKLSYIKSYRLGAFGEGDAGVTVVEFKA